MPDIVSTVADYYSAKLAEHGPSARGVDWNGEESQTLRFAELSRAIDQPDGFTVNDLGCGYGAMLDYLRERHPRCDYAGFDVSVDMVAAATAGHAGLADAQFAVAAAPTREADFGFASGVFNVKLAVPDSEWRAYIAGTLDALAATSRRGFAFNCLTSYSDPDKMRGYLHYADPRDLFDHCKRRYSRHVALLHDYGLYEFTILVRKEL